MRTRRCCSQSLASLALALLTACGEGRPALAPTAGATESGLATWYGARLRGHRMANGERFDPDAMTAAHPSLPFGTLVDVCRQGSSVCVRVRITDRGPFGDRDRIIDVSRAAASALGFLRKGLAPVDVHVVAAP